MSSSDAVAVAHEQFAGIVDSMLANGHVALAKVHVLNVPQIEAQYGTLIGAKMVRRVEQMLTRLGGQYLFTQVSPTLFGVACGTRESAEVLEAQIQQGLRELNQADEFPFLVNLAFGLVFVAAGEHTTAAEAIDRANLALLESSRIQHGVIYRHESAVMNAIREFYGRLSSASAAPGGMTWVYQPIVDVASKIRFGYEALCRWNLEPFGPIEPGIFIPIAEETGAVAHLDRWALQHAIASCPKLLEAGGSVITVNVAPSTLIDNDVFTTELHEAIQRDARLASVLVLELTESHLGRHIDLIRERIHLVRSWGVRVAFDDFGTGETSLATLATLEADFLKIDRSIVRQADARMRDGLLAISGQLADLLGAELIAEGLEVQADVDVVQAAGVRLGQGWFLGMPIAID